MQIHTEPTVTKIVGQYEKSVNAKEDKQGFDHPFEPTQNENLTPLRRRFSLQTLVQDEAIGEIEVQKKLENKDAFFKISVERAEKIDVKIGF